MNHREASRKLWTTIAEVPTQSEIDVGSLQRIADACELMAKNHAELIRERDQYERWWRDARTREEKLRRRVITRMKRKAQG